MKKNIIHLKRYISTVLGITDWKSLAITPKRYVQKYFQWYQNTTMKFNDEGRATVLQRFVNERMDEIASKASGGDRWWWNRDLILICI